MSTARRILNAANWMVNLVVILCLITAGAYAAYALWDNSQVYSAVEVVQQKLEKLKPVVEEDTGGASFEELLAVNPDVRAWVTMDGTAIDYPILQGETNLTYINRDVYGNFALAGSIYLDSRNAPDFSDAYSLLYGHHMENSAMFGDLDLYKDQEFFNENPSGILILPDRAYKLEIFACLLSHAGDEYIFEPERWQTDINKLVDFAESDHLNLRQETIDELERMDAPQVLALSTCSSEYTDARTIILAVMEPYQTAD